LRSAPTLETIVANAAKPRLFASAVNTSSRYRPQTGDRLSPYERNGGLARLPSGVAGDERSAAKSRVPRAQRSGRLCQRDDLLFDVPKSSCLPGCGDRWTEVSHRGLVHPIATDLPSDLTAPSHLWTADEIRGRPSPVPAEPGVYAWYFISTPPGVPTYDCHRTNGGTLLYVGISPKAPPRDGGRLSGQNLRRRIRYHYRGNAAGLDTTAHPRVSARPRTRDRTPQSRQR
jgi:hypothetical protein